jgi:CubicO group peptidase (beta-lactamase class C family)
MTNGRRHQVVRACFAAGAAVALLLASAGSAWAQAAVYYPGPGRDWEQRRPEDVGMNGAILQQAIAVATDPKNEGRGRDLAFFQARRHHQPLYRVVGPMKSRGAPTGVIVRRGYIVAEWGEPHRVDVVQSVTKSFLSTVVGLAHDRKMIGSVNDPVHQYMSPVVRVMPPSAGNWSRVDDMRPWEPFETEHNRKITWDHMLRQTSDWEGVIWDLPDWADRPEENTDEQVDEAWINRRRNEPGTVYKYSDVRMNALALAALMVWRRPLPEVLKELIMDPIGASNTWGWYGYENSWVVVNGNAVQSVAGGAHYGGGMMISARDMARFGYLTLRDGVWKDRQIISKDWLKMARTPGSANQEYGFANFSLNTNRRSVPAAPATAFWHSGAGINRIYVDPENDLVVVVRWIEGEHFRQFIELILKSIAGGRS